MKTNYVAGFMWSFVFITLLFSQFGFGQTVATIHQARGKALLEAKAVWGEQVTLDQGIAFYDIHNRPIVYSFAVYKSLGQFPEKSSIGKMIAAARAIRLKAENDLIKAKSHKNYLGILKANKIIAEAWREMRDDDHYGTIVVEAKLPCNAVEAYDGLPLNYVSIADARALLSGKFSGKDKIREKFVFTGLFGYYVVFDQMGEKHWVNLKTLECDNNGVNPAIKRASHDSNHQIETGNTNRLSKALEPQPPFEVKINGVPDYQSCCHKCAEHAAGDVLGYWNDRGYPLLIYDGDSGTWGDFEHGAYRLCRVELTKTMDWTYDNGTPIYNINDGIIHLCNGQDYGRNYHFQSVERGWHTPQEDYDFVKGAIYSGRPFVYTLLYQPYCGTPCQGYHTVAVMGFGAILLDSFANESLPKTHSTATNAEYYYLCHDNSPATGVDVRLYWSQFMSKGFIDTVVPGTLMNYAEAKDSSSILSYVSNYPNPFNPETAIKFHLAHESDVSVAVVNTMGQIVRVFAYSNLAPGEHQVQWKSMNEEGQSVSSGLYFYVIKAGSEQKIGKMLLVR